MSKNKKNKLSAEERRKRREERERKAHEEWLKQFECFGITTEEEVYELLYERNDCIELDEEFMYNGYHSDIPWKDDENGDEQETLHISKCGEKFIAWACGEMHDGEGYDIPAEEAIAVFDTIEEARSFLDKFPEGESSLQDQVMDCKEKLEDPAYWIKTDLGGWGQKNFMIYYDHGLIIENLGSLKAIDYIKESIKKYKMFKAELEERGVALICVDKRPREWNRNERFYDYEIRYKNHWYTLSGQILSRMQHQTRETIDLFPMEALQKFIEEADGGDPYPGRTKKEKAKLEKEEKAYKERLEASYQGIKHDGEILPVQLTKNQKKSLDKYLYGHMPFGSCDGTLKHTVQWTIENIPEEDRAGVLESIRNGGGYCDCEVVMNYLI
ncbi:MAG: DUF2695 domain-containing protein [Clostridiales bacterium]|nr:DUF2695 domain-containing protein [Clostridiales bacterium]